MHSSHSFSGAPGRRGRASLHRSAGTGGRAGRHGIACGTCRTGWHAEVRDIGPGGLDGHSGRRGGWQRSTTPFSSPTCPGMRARCAGIRGCPRSASAAVSSAPRHAGAPPRQPRSRWPAVPPLTRCCQYSDVVTGGSGPQPCDAVTAAGLRVYPPDQTASKIVPFPLKACTSSGLVYMGVAPVQQARPPGQQP